MTTRPKVNYLRSASIVHPSPKCPSSNSAPPTAGPLARQGGLIPVMCSMDFICIVALFLFPPPFGLSLRFSGFGLIGHCKFEVKSTKFKFAKKKLPYTCYADSSCHQADRGATRRYIDIGLPLWVFASSSFTGIALIVYFLIP